MSSWLGRSSRAEAQAEVLLFAAFHFDPEAAKDIDELDPKKAGMQLLKLQWKHRPSDRRSEEEAIKQEVSGSWVNPM